MKIIRKINLLKKIVTSYVNKPQVKKLDRIEKSLTDNIAIIESTLEGLKSDFNYIKNMPDYSVEKEKEINIDFNVNLPSFVEVVNRLKKLEDETYNHLTDIDRRIKKLEK
jgi:hypothetical protein